MMTTTGWIIFGAVCILLLAMIIVSILRLKNPYKVLAVVLAVALGVGAYFGGVAIFPVEKVEEPVVEEPFEAEVPESVEVVEAGTGN